MPLTSGLDAKWTKKPRANNEVESYAVGGLEDEDAESTRPDLQPQAKKAALLPSRSHIASHAEFSNSYERDASRNNAVRSV